MEPLDSLRAACPALVLRTDPETLDAAGVDAMRASRGRPDLLAERIRPVGVAEPASAAEVAALVAWAGAERTAIVPRGGGSGLMGGAAVLRRAVVVDLHRLDAVSVDPDAGLVRAGAGAVLARVDRALAEHGLMLGHDPWTAGVATVGGALSTNGLGYLGARAGSIGAQLRGIAAVLADGRIVRTPAVPTRSVGLELAHLFVGTEGTLGVITEAVLAVLPRPEERVVAQYRLPSFSAGVAVTVALGRAGIRLACLELSADRLPPAPAFLLVVFDGLRGEAAIHAERAAGIIREAGGDALPRAAGEAAWNERHAIAERWAARPRFRTEEWQPDQASEQFDYVHVGVPVHALATVRDAAHALIRRHGLTLVEEGLWHRPELYSVVVGGPAGSAADVQATMDGVCRAAQDAGGAMEYCHGVGWKLAHLMEREHGAAGLDVLRRIKAALDPAGILNPGKAAL